MRRLLIGVGLLALGGCASSTHAQREAAEHQARADQSAANRDYYGAAREQQKADEYQRKAAERRMDEACINTPPPTYLPPPLEPTIP